MTDSTADAYHELWEAIVYNSDSPEIIHLLDALLVRVKAEVRAEETGKDIGKLVDRARSLAAYQDDFAIGLALNVLEVQAGLPLDSTPPPSRSALTVGDWFDEATAEGSPS